MTGGRRISTENATYNRRKKIETKKIKRSIEIEIWFKKDVF